MKTLELLYQVRRAVLCSPHRLETACSPRHGTRRMARRASVWLGLGAFLMVGLVLTAGGAERSQAVVRRVIAPSAPGTTPEPTNAPKVFRVAGTAVDASGKPVAGAVVECYQQSARRERFAATDMEVKQRVTTGTNGGFDFKVTAAPTVLIGRKPGLAIAWAQYWNPNKDVLEEQLSFTPPTEVKGMVVDEADKPVADAEVWVWYACSVRELEEGRQSYAYLSGKPLRDCFSSRTATDGSFTIQGFPTNSSADFAVKKEGKVLRELPREYLSPETMRFQPGMREVRLVVEPSGAIEGKVVAQDTKEALAGMRLSLRSDRLGPSSDRLNEPAFSGTDGTFRLADVAPGSYDIYSWFGTNQMTEWVAENVPVTVEGGQTTRDVQVAATRGGLLEVTVIGKVDRQPLAGASINANKPAYQGGTGSDSNGVAVLRLPPGEYNISAYMERSRSEGEKATVEVGQTNRLEIQMNPPPKIAGTVQDLSGAALAGVAVSVIPNWGNQDGGVSTDAKGHYEIAWDSQRYGSTDRSFAILACDAERGLAVAQDIDESTKALDLRLEPGLVIAGRVEDEKGKALTNAAVDIYLWSGNSGHQFGGKPIRTDAQGRFEAGGLPRGRKYSMNAKAKGYGSVSRTIQEDSETNRVEVETCVLKAATCKLAGEVVGTDDKPAARAHVYMYGDGQPNTSTRTDDKGRFKFDAVCEGTISVSASLQNSYGNARAQAGDTNVVIRLGVNRSYSSSSAPKRSSLKGKTLPDLTMVELSADAVPAGKPVLLCLFDVEQRPSRRFIKQLAEQLETLQQKGVTVLGLQAAVTTADSFKEWKDANPVSFPVGRVGEKTDKTKWACNVEKLPWLILTDRERRVTTEGFALDELETKLKALSE